MKKLLILFATLAVAINCVEAKDYAKMQIKEMKHAQKYSTTKNVVKSSASNKTFQAADLQLKDPHIMKFGHYDIISTDKYNAKIKKDETKYKDYAEQLGKKHSKYYTTQADAEDFYTVYRVAEKIIRANNLDYMNWRICLKKSVDNTNAYSDGSNLVVITTSLFVAIDFKSSRFIL